jgi:hypothetical protein
VAVARFYNISVFATSTPLGTGATVTTTSPTAILCGTTTATNDMNISAVRAGAFGSGSGFPSNANYTASLNLATTTVTGGQTATARLLGGGSNLASQTTWKTAGGTSAAALASLVLSTYLWSQEVPFTAGANWGEWFTPNFEINVPVSTQVALYITAFSAGTGTTFGGEIEYSE